MFYHKSGIVLALFVSVAGLLRVTLVLLVASTRGLSFQDGVVELPLPITSLTTLMLF